MPCKSQQCWACWATCCSVWLSPEHSQNCLSLLISSRDMSLVVFLVCHRACPPPPLFFLWSWKPTKRRVTVMICFPLHFFVKTLLFNLAIFFFWKMMVRSPHLLEVDTAQRYSLCRQRHSCKYWEIAVTYILLSSICWYLKHVTNSYRKINSKRSAFASCNHARALAAGLLRTDHVWITANQ